MTTVVYERLGGKVICHITRDQKKTVCKKAAHLMLDLYAGKVPETNCKECWPRFS